MWNLEVIQMDLKNRASQTYKMIFWLWGVVGAGERKRIIREFGMDMCTLLYLKWITN